MLLIGYLINKYNQLPSSRELDPIIAPSNLRALAVILLGVFCFTISETIRNAELSVLKKRLLIAVENICWIISLLFIVSTLSKKYEGIVVLIMAVAVAICFSRDFTSVIYNNSFVRYLGRISLTVYLCQNVTRKLIREQFDLTNRMTVVAIIVFTILLGVVIDYLCNRKKTAIQSK